MRRRVDPAGRNGTAVRVAARFVAGAGNAAARFSTKGVFSMIRHKSLLIILAVGLAGACDETESSDILGVPTDQAMRVGIAGPLVVRENGTYQWHARLFGDAAGAEFTWEVIRTNVPDELRTRVIAAPVFETYIDLNDWGTFELVLTARSGEQLAVDRAVITICPYIEELVDECTARLAFAKK
jgi:hypothetical protein